MAYKMENAIFLISKDELRDLMTETLNSYFAAHPLQQDQPSEPEDDVNKYYDRSELCKLAHISSTTLWRMEKEGLVEKRKFGRKNLYLRADIDRLLATGKLHLYTR